MISLQRRLQLGLGLSILVFIVLFLGLTGYAVRQLGESYVLSRLEHDAESLLGNLQLGHNGAVRLRGHRLTTVYQQPQSGHYFIIDTGNGVYIRSRSLWDFELDSHEVVPGERRVEYRPGPGQQHLLILAVGYRKLDNNLTLTVAEDIAPLANEIHRYQWWLGGTVLVLLGLLLVLQNTLVRRMFLHLDRVRRDIRRIAEGQATQLDEEVPSEVMPLVQEVNRLLGLLSQRIERSRHALGNLAHALKTPLNMLGQELDELDGQTPPQSVQRLRSQCAQIHALTERELRRSRLAGQISPGQHFDADKELPALVQVLQRMYAGRHLQITLNGLPSHPLPIDREDMLELLGNLLDNACKWAGSCVQVTFSENTRLHITVEDDGPGVATKQIDALTTRGARIDEGVAGHGLGLAIVHDAVRLYHGELLFTRSPLGGLQVDVVLPLARQDDGE